MLRQFSRYGLAAFAAGAVALVLLAIATESGTGAHAQRGEDEIIEILDSGFNPAYCQLNRHDTRVRWENKSSVIRRIRFPIASSSSGVVYFDTGDMEPGDVSPPFAVSGPTNKTYNDYYDESLTGQIVAPLSPGAPTICDAQPPTPTPTPTPTMTPMPSPSPSPTPVQRPPACEGLMPISRQPVDGCGISGYLARD